MDDLRYEPVGLGLAYEEVVLVEVRTSWAVIAAELAQHVRTACGSLAVAVEQVGSTTVPGMLAKPIVDLALGVAAPLDLPPIKSALIGLGWIYRGDAGDDGGQVFVLESRPSFRVAHLHVVDHDGPQWRAYLHCARSCDPTRKRGRATRLRKRFSSHRSKGGRFAPTTPQARAR